MAPATDRVALAPNSGRKLKSVTWGRWRQAPREVEDSKSFPVWTRGDESDDEDEQPSRLRRRRFRGRSREVDRARQLDRREDNSGTVNALDDSSLSDGVSSPDDGVVSAQSGEDSPPSEDESSTSVQPPPPTATIQTTELLFLSPTPPFVELPEVTQPPPPAETTSTTSEPPPPPPPETTSTSTSEPPPPPPPPPSSSSSERPPPPRTTFEPRPAPVRPTLESSSPPPPANTSPTEAAGPLTTITVGIPAPTRNPENNDPSDTQIFSPPPAFPTEARKGVVTDGANASTPVTTSGPALESGEADRAEQYRQHHEKQTSPSEAAAHALGSVGGVICLFAIGFLIWYYFRKYRPKQRVKKGLPPRSGRARKLFGRLPFVKPPREPEWIIEAAPDARAVSDEKDMYGQPIGLGAPPSVRPQTQDTQQSYVPRGQLSMALPPVHLESEGSYWPQPWPADKDGNRPGHGPQPSMGSMQAQYNNSTMRSVPSYYLKRQSEISSLSSGFGDGDIMPPSTANNTLDAIAVTQLRAPPTAAVPSNRLSVRTESTSRDTWYTEASEDQPARFRSINSWVRQQTGRIKREKQRQADSDVPPVPAIPPEPEYRMMMPDGEEPRRVDPSMGGTN